MTDKYKTLKRIDIKSHQALDEFFAQRITELHTNIENNDGHVDIYKYKGAIAELRNVCRQLEYYRKLRSVGDVDVASS